jgi:hypothetical protein
MDKRDYEWHYFIGGDCALIRRKYGGAIARIYQREQGIYEAMILREHNPYKTVPLGVFNDSNEAQEVIHQVLEPVWEKT